MEFYILNNFFSHIPSIVALLLLFSCLSKWKNSNSTLKHPPLPSGSWPVIGHLHLLGLLPHIPLGKMADKYGPIFMIKLGFQRALVVSSHAMAKECLGVNDKAFMNRHHATFVEHLTYNSAMFGHTPNGSYWRDLRKITTVELLSNSKVEAFKHVRISELRLAIKDIYDKYCVNENKEAMDMKQWFNDINLNSIVKLIAGKSLKGFYPGEKFYTISKSIKEFSEFAGAFVPGDALPFLRWIDFGGYEKRMKTVAKELDQVTQEWLDDHKRRRISKKGKDQQDFMDVMLGLYEADEDIPRKFAPDTIIKATCMNLIVAGTDPTAVTLTWAVSLLLNNRDAMKKVQAEMDATVGKERLVNETDLNNLPYLDAALKETMRLYPAGPLSIPRVTTEDCTANGYHIPTGTQLLVNLYKIQRDPEVWPNPLEFHPEKFLTTHKDYDFRGANFTFIPFGAGRRMCPAVTLAYKTMMMTLATLVHGFEISTPSNETVDMTEGYGMSNMKASPLEVILTPRLHDNLYNPSAIVTDVS